MTSASVVMTKGPYCTTGSPSGSPAERQTISAVLTKAPASPLTSQQHELGRLILAVLDLDAREIVAARERDLGWRVEIFKHHRNVLHHQLTVWCASQGSALGPT